MLKVSNIWFIYRLYSLEALVKLRIAQNIPIVTGCKNYKNTINYIENIAIKPVKKVLSDTNKPITNSSHMIVCTILFKP